MPKAKSTARQDILKLKVKQPEGHYRLADYQISESIGYLLKRSYLLLSAEIDRELAPYELTHPQFAILMTIKERNCTTAAEIARETCADTGAVTRMLDRLEAKQILRRVRSSEDRRLVRIEMTESGRLVMDKMPVVAINVLNRHLENFDAKEIASLKQLLRKLIGGIETADSAPAADDPAIKTAAPKTAAAKTRRKSS